MTTCIACEGFPSEENNPCGLCGATAETALPGAEVRAPAGGRPALIGDLLDKDIAFLRTVTYWMEDKDAEWSNMLAELTNRFEVVTGAYLTHLRNTTTVTPNAALRDGLKARPA